MYVNFGWIRGGGGGIMSLLYSALQWLHKGVAPASVDDRTANELDADYVDSNCVVTDGTADSLSFGTIDVSAWTTAYACVSVNLTELPPSGIDIITSLQHTGGDDLGIYFSASAFSFSVDDGTRYTSQSVQAPAANTNYKLEFMFDGSDVWGVINNLDTGAIETTPKVSASFNFATADGLLELFKRSGSAASYTKCNAWDFCFGQTCDNLTVCTPMAGGLGMGLDEPDVSGNANDGTWTVGAGGVATLRSGLQSVYHYNTLNGHTPSINSTTVAGYYNTGIKSSSTICVEALIRFPANEPAEWCLIGSGKSADANQVRFGTTLAGDFQANFGSESIGGLTYTTDPILIKICDGELWIDGVSQGTFGGSFIDANAINIFLFAQNLDDVSVVRNAKGDLFWAKFSDSVSGEVYGHFFPTNDGLLYDDVSRTTLAPVVAGSLASAYYPALADGSDDVLGLGLTNPYTTGQIHNNSEAKIQQSDYNLIDIQVSGGCDCLLTYAGTPGGKPAFENGIYYSLYWETTYWTFTDGTEAWDWSTSYTGTFPPVGVASGSGSLGSDPVTLDYNEFWVVNAEWDKKSFADLRTHLSFDENVVVCSTASSIIAAWTWGVAYEWTPTAYQQVINYLAAQGCTGTSLIPYPVTAGTGIGPSGAWYTYDGTNIYLVEDA